MKIKVSAVFRKARRHNILLQLNKHIIFEETGALPKVVARRA